MIRAWTILEPKAKNPKPYEIAWSCQYPLFFSLSAAREFRNLHPLLPAKVRIVRCQIRIEGERRP